MAWRAPAGTTGGPARAGAGDLLGFLAFSHGWTWACWLLAARLGESVWEPPAVYFFYLGGIGVPLGAVVLSGAVGGRAGVADLGRRLVDFRRVPGRWWLVVLLFFPALTLLAAGLALALGVTPQPLDLGGAAARLAQPGQLLAFAFFILLIGPPPEEIGWRGYLLDRLQLRWNALAASLLLALVWWTWHLPLFALPGYFEAFARSPAPQEILLGLLPAAILYTWVYNNTGRSVLAVILLHFLENFTGEFLGIAPEARAVRRPLTYAAALGVVWWWGPRTLRRGAAGGGSR